MADTDNSEAILEFCNLTGTDPSRARFYLEAAGWDKNLAMASYYEEADEEREENAGDVYQRPGSPKPNVSSKDGARIATFASLMNEAEDDEEEGQAFYAGGSERSGQQVLGPGKRKSGNRIVEDMFNAVRKYGGEVLDPSAKRPNTTKLRAFRGTGYVLGSTPDNSDAVASDTSDDRPQEVEIRLRLWQSGFTVDDGQLRDYSEPENKEFLDAIRQGEIPMELRQQANGREVHLSLEDHSHEEFVPPRRTLQAFTGTGFRLGSISPVMTPAPTADKEKNVEEAQESVKVDDSKPVTSIQIRVADGSRLVMKANRSHTVGDIRKFIVQARPEFSASVFSLMTAFPSKELSDDDTTLEEANLLNAVIVQKLK